MRKELNERMDRGEDGARILEWLNAEPKVWEVIKEGFDGAPISKQNLSDWRQGGFRDWEIRQELFSEAGEAGELRKKVDAPLLAGDLLTVVMAHYAKLMNHWDGGEDAKFEAGVRRLRGLLRDFALARKSAAQDQKAAEGGKERRSAARTGLPGGMGMMESIRALLGGAEETAEGKESGQVDVVKGGEADCSSGTLSQATGTVALPGTRLREDASAREVAEMPESVVKAVLANVVELKAAGPGWGASPVVPGKGQSCQKLSFDAAGPVRERPLRLEELGAGKGMLVG